LHDPNQASAGLIGMFIEIRGNSWEGLLKLYGDVYD
jgi:hypothetical protein